MEVSDNSIQILVSVIVPCYNQGRYLATAIESILYQSYKYYEIIVVDDGSTDNTKEEAAKFSGVTYIYQPNSGLSAARNTGIEYSHGQYLVFLDSDDWLLPEALETNVHYLTQQPALAFVSGAHQFFYSEKGEKRNVIIEVANNHYCHLLERNYIAMIATVMFRRWVFDTYKYDTSLKVCEDYDLYLHISRKYPILHHTKIIAVYHIHNTNGSGSTLIMLNTVLKVLQRQRMNLRDDEEEKWYEKGIIFWKSHYTERLYSKIITLLYEGKKIEKNEVQALKEYNKVLYNTFTEARKSRMINKLKAAVKLFKKLFLPAGYLNNTKKLSIPKPLHIVFGDFNRTQPFSTQFGYDRGGPVDRYYIENFLQNNTAAINGSVLEIGDNEYTLRFGKEKVLQSDILHIDESNEKATYVGDLSNAPRLPDNSFDCIVLTQTLHLIYEYKKAIETCYRVLKPNGKLLITVPGISHIAQDQWGKYWFWSFTDNAIQKILSEYFSPDKITVETYGNVLVATAFLYGMGLPELTKEQMETRDPHYQVIITACATK